MALCKDNSYHCDYPKCGCTSDRADVFSLIEEFITRARPDIAECLDCILPPMIRALETRYCDADLQDVRIDYRALRESLEELARSIPPSLEDSRYEDYKATQEH